MALIFALVLLTLRGIAAVPVTSQEAADPLEKLADLETSSALNLDETLGRDKRRREALSVEEPIALLIGKDVKSVLAKKAPDNNSRSSDSEELVIGSNELTSTNDALMKILDNIFLEDPEDVELRDAVAHLLKEVQDIEARKTQGKHDLKNGNVKNEKKAENRNDSDVKLDNDLNTYQESRKDARRTLTDANDKSLQKNGKDDSKVKNGDNDAGDNSKAGKHETRADDDIEDPKTSRSGSDENERNGLANSRKNRRKIHILKKSRNHHDFGRKFRAPYAYLRNGNNDHSGDDVEKHGDHNKSGDEHHDQDRSDHGDAQKMQKTGQSDEVYSKNEKSHHLDRNDHDEAKESNKDGNEHHSDGNNSREHHQSEEENNNSDHNTHHLRNDLKMKGRRRMHGNDHQKTVSHELKSGEDRHDDDNLKEEHEKAHDQYKSHSKESRTGESGDSSDSSESRHDSDVKTHSEHNDLNRDDDSDVTAIDIKLHGRDGDFNDDDDDDNHNRESTHHLIKENRNDVEKEHRNSDSDADKQAVKEHSRDRHDENEMETKGDLLGDDEASIEKPVALSDVYHGRKHFDHDSVEADDLKTDSVVLELDDSSEEKVHHNRRNDENNKSSSKAHTNEQLSRSGNANEAKTDKSDEVNKKYHVSQNKNASLKKYSLTFYFDK